MNLKDLIKEVEYFKKYYPLCIQLEYIKKTVEVVDKQIISYLLGRLHPTDKRQWNKIKNLFNIK